MRSQVDHLQLLGRGGQALVLRGLWQQAEVAVKLAVANPDSMTSSTLSKCLLEGPLSKSLRAPNIVETYGYMCTQLSDGDVQACRQEADRPGASASSSCHLLSSSRGSHVVERLSLGPDGVGVVPSAASFDSLDGFGSPQRRRSTAAALSYSEALRMAGAAPGAFVTQIVMELCDQGSLADAVARGAYTRAAEDRGIMFCYLRTLYDIAVGMSYLHSNGVIHGDLKPGNVLLRSSRIDSRGYQAKVADFGLASCRDLAAGGDSGGAGAGCGEADWSSYSYMAPEHFDGMLVPASDVWAFAATAHHMWTGQLPYAGLHPAAVCAGLCEGDLALAPPAGMPRRLWRLLRACLAREAALRPSFPQIRAALKQLEAELCGA